MLTHTYARLLSKWDKREGEGRDLERDADMLFESVLGGREDGVRTGAGAGDGGSSGSRGAGSEGGDDVRVANSLSSLGAMVAYPIKM